MKRIGIITIQKCDNFGADLQAYALQAKLRMLGYDAENIDYLFYKHSRHFGGKSEMPVPWSELSEMGECGGWLIEERYDCLAIGKLTVGDYDKIRNTCVQ